MNDELVCRIFVELAVLEGKRDVNGKWLIKEAAEVSKLLRRARTMVERASSDEAPPKQARKS